MYVPAAFALDDQAARAVIADASIATVVTHDAADGFDAAVVPMLLEGDRLLGHVAKANPIWRRSGQVIALFTPVDGYVSPSWYPSKREHGRVVPTWNYVTVAAHGTMTARTDEAFLFDVVTALTEAHEARIGSDWQVTDAPSDYVESMLRAIVGIEIAITRLEGKAKLSQNRPGADVESVIAANDNSIGAAMRAANRE